MNIMVNGESMAWQPDMKVRDILNIRNYTFKMLVIKVNGTLVKRAQWDSYRIPEHAEVSVIHLISGG